MRKFVLSTILVLMAFAMNAQNTSRLSVGLGGGMSSSATASDYRFTPGALGSLDLGYTFLAPVSPDVKLGIRTGVNAVYANSSLNVNYADYFVYRDYRGDVTDYLVASSNVSYRQNQISVEVPVMFAFENKGFFFNVGMKFQIPVYTSYKQEIENPMIVTYNQVTGNYTSNDPLTGTLTDAQKSMSGKGYNAYCYFAFSAEIGKVWRLKGNHSLGFTAFVDYAPFSCQASGNSEKKLIEVTHTDNYIGDNPATVNVNQLTACGKYSLVSLNAGLKLVYTFDFVKSKE